MMLNSMESLVKFLEGTGMVKSAAVRNAMLKVDRAAFCSVDPYDDAPQNIGYNATISAPHMHAFALEKSLLCSGPESSKAQHPLQKILDVGSGSGYLTVALATLHPQARVIGIEHVPELVRLAQDNIRRAHLDPNLRERIKMVEGDGREGWSEDAPYDYIHVGAASSELPQKLVQQLAPEGVMVVPVGSFLWQDICVVRKRADGSVEVEQSLPVRYVPLTDKEDQIG